MSGILGEAKERGSMVMADVVVFRKEPVWPWVKLLGPSLFSVGAKDAKSSAKDPRFWRLFHPDIQFPRNN